MAKNNQFVHRDFNQQEIQNGQFHQATPGFDGHETRTIDRRQVQLNGSVKTYAFLDDLAQNPVQLVGTHDASGGALPAGAGIVPGYKYVVTVDGTIAGIQGDDELTNGDMLLFVGSNGGTDDPTDPAQWVGVQQNQNDSAVGAGDFERQTVSLAANTPLTVTAAKVADIHSIQVYLASGEEITDGIAITKTANPNERVLESNIALANIEVELGGIL